MLCGVLYVACLNFHGTVFCYYDTVLSPCPLQFSLAVAWSSQSSLSSGLLSATRPLLQERAKEQSSSSDSPPATATEQVFLTGLKVGRNWEE